ncbi:MAG: CHASE3 domain-containing protein [Candidatus Obscuribacterales bacterium]|jgi:CHASE3 domain sensor protein
MPRNHALILCAALLNIVLLFAIGLAFKQVDNERLEQIRDREIVVECNQVTKLFNDAGVAIGGYSISMSPMFAERYLKIAEELRSTLRHLKTLIDDSKQQAIFARVESAALEGLKTMEQAKGAIDDSRADVGQHRSRHMYKGLREFSEELQQEMQTLTPANNAPATPSTASVMVFAFLIISTLLNLVIAALMLPRKM